MNEKDAELLAEFRAAWDRSNDLKCEVLNWLNAEVQAGKPPRKRRAPMWDDYDKSSRELYVAMERLARGENHES